MKTVVTAILTLMLFGAECFAMKAMDEKSIAKVLQSVEIAKEHKNINAMKKYFLSRASISLTDQDIDDSNTQRLNLNEYTRHLSKKWKNTQSNLIEVQERSFSIDPNGKSALVKTTLVQTIETNKVKTATTIYETTGLKLVNGQIYINYYSSRTMLNTALRVN
ncbi:MAG: hypothetical protein IBX43_08620 [Campylobacterales bacterium]|nr:hypothetical protein [Campylobacterales bacterium]